MQQYRLEYLYRDAANFKAYDEIAIDEQHLARLQAGIDEEIYFVPEQVGIPPLQHRLWAFGGPNDQDHEWHEVVSISPSGGDPEIGLPGPVRD